MYPIPPIGTVGTYTLLAPLDSAILSDDQYTCKAIRKISEYVASNEDVQQLAYTNNGLSASIYENHLASDETIVSLQSQVGHWLYVPVSYISSYPSGNGIVYKRTILGIDLGLIPEDADIDSVIAAVSNAVKDSYGVNPKVKVTYASKNKVLDKDKHTTFQNQRLMNMTSNLTDSSKYKRLVTMYNSALAKITALETYILSKKNVLGI